MDLMSYKQIQVFISVIGEVNDVQNSSDLLNISATFSAAFTIAFFFTVHAYTSSFWRKRNLKLCWKVKNNDNLFLSGWYHYKYHPTIVNTPYTQKRLPRKYFVWMCPRRHHWKVYTIMSSQIEKQISNKNTSRQNWPEEVFMIFVRFYCFSNFFYC